MKKAVSVLAFIALAASLAAAQTLMDNSYFQRSQELRSLAQAAFEDGDYDAASDYAAQAEEYARLSDQYVEKMVAVDRADRAMSRAEDRIAWADSTGAAERNPEAFQAAVATMELSDAAYQAEDYDTAVAKADEVMVMTEDMYASERERADEALAKARERMAWAATTASVRDNFPNEYQTAFDEMSLAESSYVGKDFGAAVVHADQVLAALANATEIHPYPGVYVVRRVESKTDCLWRIASFPFVYNDPMKWTKLYEANKRGMRDPANPDLIFPGQRIVIPSIAGEKREGTYDPDVNYGTFGQ